MSLALSLVALVVGVSVGLVMGVSAATPIASHPIWMLSLTTSHQSATVAVFWVSLGLAFFLFWWPRRKERRSFGLLVGGSLGVIGFALGLASYAPCSGDQSPVITPITWTLGLLAGSVERPFGVVQGCPPTMPLALQTARLAQLCVTLLGAGGVVGAVFRRQWDRVRARYTRSVILVIGLDRAVLPVIRGLALRLESHTLLVVLDFGNDGPAANEARLLGACVMAAEPTDEETIEAVVTWRGAVVAKAVYVLGASPNANIASVRAIENVLSRSASATASIVPRLIVRFDDPWFAEDWRRTHISRSQGWLTDAISTYEETARLLLDRARLVSADQLIIVGASRLTLALLSECSQRQRESRMLFQAENSVAAWADPTPLIRVIDPEATRLRSDHILRQRRFGNVAELRCEVIEAVPTAELVTTWASRTNSPVVIVTDGDEGGHQPLSQRLAASHPDLTVFSATEGVVGLAEEPLMGRLHTFGLTLLDREGTPEDNWERIARLLHEEYIRAYPDPPGVPVKASRRRWDDGLPEFYRTSNVRQLKELLSGSPLRTWGAAVVEGEPISNDEFDPTEIALLAESEHESWRRYYLARRWRWGPEVREQDRRHPLLVPWADLPEDAKERTRASVRRGLALLRSLGYHSTVRGWSTYERVGTVRAERLSTTWTWLSESGATMTASAGDWRVIGADGRAWSVDDAVFSSTYVHVADQTWRRVGTVRARPARPGEMVQTMEGPVPSDPEDLIVEGGGGDRWPVSRKRFEATYVLLGDDVKSGATSHNSISPRGQQR